jgi:hypothetical protein
MPPEISSLPTGNQPAFFGQKVSFPGVNVNNATGNQLMYVNNYSQETYYAQDSSNISFGNLTNGGQGMQVVNSNGNVVFEMDGQTWYWFDDLGNVVMMTGYLPVAQIFGWAVAAPGQSLAGVV